MRAWRMSKACTPVTARPGWKQKIKILLGGTRLSHHYYLFLLVHTLFLVFTRIPAVFINTLLMNQTGDVNATLFFNGSIFMACALTMFISAQLLHCMQCRYMAAAGIIGYNVLYICYVLFQSGVGEYYLLFGLFNGMADGFYYISYGRMVLLYTDVQNRDSGMGIISTLSAGVNLAIPFLSGTVISLIGGIRGYAAVFSIAFLVAFVTMLTVFRLPQEEKTGGGHVRYIQFLRLVQKKKLLQMGLAGELLKGMREGTFMFILNIILYQLIRSEFLIGCNSLVTGFISILSFWYMSRFFTPGNRARHMFVSVTVLAVINLMCLQIVTPVMVLLFAAVNAFFAGLIEVSCYTTFFDVSQKVEEAEEFTPELLAFHELFVVSGRCIGLGFFALMNTFYGATLFIQVLSLLLLTLTQYGTAAICKRALRTG